MTMPMPPMRDPESAKRFMHALNLHRTVLSNDEIIAKRWMAVRLIDGSSDGQVYDTWQDAAKHQLSPERCQYFKIPLERLSVNACDSLLWYWRKVYDAGWRPDVDTPLLLMTPNQIEIIEGGVKPA